MQEAEKITDDRLNIWNTYHRSLEKLERAGQLRRPIIPEGCKHNAHMYYILLDNLEQRTALIKAMKSMGVLCVFHYVPLHSADPSGIPTRNKGQLNNTNDLADRLLRLPLWVDLAEDQQTIIDLLINSI
jgi:dTDP-4-amino-4,6-dideoxygalactose transaminase